MNEGLTSAEAAARLAQYGLNDATAKHRPGPIALILPFFANPLVMVLLAAAVVSGFLGDLTNASIIAVLVGASVALDTLQTLRSRAAVTALQSKVAPTATAMRDGKWKVIPRKEIVPGDVVQLSAGDLVPADGALLTEKDLHVQESALTGESMPTEKEVGTGDDRERAFLGTSVVSGAATMRVEKTGAQTSLGGIAARLAEKPPETEFERGLRTFGGLITRIVLLLIGFTLVAMLGFQRPPLQSLMFAVALAVGLTPEFLPMITTITLARGAMRMAKKKVIVKSLAAIPNFGSMDILCSDKTGTLTTGEMTLARRLGLDGAPSEEPIKWGLLNAANASGVPNPLDAAILTATNAEEGWTKVDEIPFDFERRRVSIVVEKAGRRVLIAKGAPENVFQACPNATMPECVAQMGKEGFRVLAVAIKDVPEQKVYGVEDEKDLQPVGLLGFFDPPLPDALETIKALNEAGVDLKILTGDSDAVTTHVCAQIGLDPGTIVLGAEIEKLNDDALRVVAERTNVFARVSPAQKNRVILALKARHHVVGYMGDGINDAPSLHTADVGISFASATDIAKDSAQIILVDRSLELLHEAVIEGRMAFGNVMKYLLMGTSSNFGNVFSMAGAALFLPFLPMLPRQILLNNLLYDLSQVTIPTDNVDIAYTKTPKRWDMRLIKAFMLIVGPISSLFDVLTFVVLLHFFHAGPAEFQTGWFVESLATQTLVIFVIRTRALPWRSRPSTPLTCTVLAVVALGVALPFLPFAHVFGFVPLPLAYFAFLLPATLFYLAAVSLVKGRLFAKYDAPTA